MNNRDALPSDDFHSRQPSMADDQSPMPQEDSRETILREMEHRLQALKPTPPCLDWKTLSSQLELPAESLSENRIPLKPTVSLSAGSRPFKSYRSLAFSWLGGMAVGACLTLLCVRPGTQTEVDILSKNSGTSIHRNQQIAGSGSKLNPSDSSNLGESSEQQLASNSTTQPASDFLSTLDQQVWRYTSLLDRKSGLHNESPLAAGRHLLSRLPPHADAPNLLEASLRDRATPILNSGPQIEFTPAARTPTRGNLLQDLLEGTRNQVL